MQLLSLLKAEGKREPREGGFAGNIVFRTGKARSLEAGSPDGEQPVGTLSQGQGLTLDG